MTRIAILLFTGFVTIIYYLPAALIALVLNAILPDRKQ